MERNKAECILCGKKVESKNGENETICDDCLDIMVIEQNYKEASLNQYQHLTFF
jgi:predicted nucleic acid-binding Zn ribbon protein